MSDKQEPVVTQADIDRANAFWGVQIAKVMDPEKNGKSAFADTDGPIEQNDLVLAFARHRLASTSADAERVAELEDALRQVAGCAYPVSAVINERGYNWSEAYLDRVKPTIDALLGAKP